MLKEISIVIIAKKRVLTELKPSVLNEVEVSFVKEVKSFRGTFGHKLA